MISSKAIIDCYLDTISKLTGASSVNLCLTENASPLNPLNVYQSDASLLPEFETQNFQLLLSQLQKSETETVYEKAPLGKKISFEIVEGLKPKSRLLRFNLSLELGFNTSLTSIPVPLKNRRESDSALTSFGYSLWLGLDFCKDAPDWYSQKNLNQNVQTNCTLETLLQCLLQLGALLTQHLENTTKLLSDPMTALSGRIEFQNNLSLMLTKSSRIAMLLINPSEFQLVNKRFGHAAGDRVIGQTAQNLKSLLRNSDLISRFGGALFAIAMPLKQHDDIHKIAVNLRSKLQQPEYLDGAVTPDFNLGIAEVETQASKLSPCEQVNELIGKAEQALHVAKTEEESNIVMWHPQDHKKHLHQQDYIGGIFTADTTTDYRNMLLLWDISNLTASFYQFDLLLAKFIKRLAQTFDFIYAGMVPYNNNPLATSSLCFQVDAQDQINNLDSSIAALQTKTCQAYLTQAKSEPVYQSIEKDLTLYCAALSDSGEALFFLIGNNQHFELANDSRILLTALVKQLGRAHARAQLEEQLNQQLVTQKEKLRLELEELKQSLQSSEVHYCSAPMEALMKLAQRTALSDATTLIIGESGTGKGRLVKAMHQMGQRKKAPLVIVDCGAIPENLIESELFGHTKGAFTGAHNHSKGKILEANGGTLMLDEIGELPLQMQSKLLRFVQEKQFTPVGGTKVVEVDVKIIAATNRDLQKMLQQGNFRQDLFYRLNVITLRTPPLRERHQDIQLLCKHFLKVFANQHGESVKSLSPQAAQFMQDYSWPGNVRELENRLLQATLLCEGEEIQLIELNISELEAPLLEKTATASQSSPLAPVMLKPLINWQQPEHSQPELTIEPVLSNIKGIFIELIDQIMSSSMAPDFPIGRWLEQDIIMMTHVHCDNNSKRTSMRLGIPHSTLRRQLSKINQLAKLESRLMAGSWQSLLESLKPIVAGQIYIGNDSIKQLKLLLLSTIIESSITNVAVASALMGISEPTYYKWKKELAATDI